MKNNSDSLLTQEFTLINEEAAAALAQQLSTCLTYPLTLTFSGEIGAGKTTFIRYVLRALGVEGSIKSPTFSLVESYPISTIHVHHFDLYRIDNEAELDYLGFRDFFGENALCCIEWPERALHCLGQIDIHTLLIIKESERLMRFYARSCAGEKILACLAGRS